MVDLKLKLYKVTRYYAAPAEAYVIARNRKQAIELSNDYHGKADSEAKEIKLKKAKVIY